MLTTRKLFTYVLIGIVILITAMALLGIWEIVDWGFFRKYFWKSVKSLIVILFGGLVVYIIQSVFYKEEPASLNGKEDAKNI